MGHRGPVSHRHRPDQALTDYGGVTHATSVMPGGEVPAVPGEVVWAPLQRLVSLVGMSAAEALDKGKYVQHLDVQVCVLGVRCGCVYWDHGWDHGSL